MSSHLFVYKLYSEEVLMREYVCTCQNCLDLKFDQCLTYENDGNIKSEEIRGQGQNAPADTENEETEYEDCELDEDDKHIDKVLWQFEFIELSTYVAVMTGNTTNPVYIISRER